MSQCIIYPSRNAHKYIPPFINECAVTDTQVAIKKSPFHPPHFRNTTERISPETPCKGTFLKPPCMYPKMTDDHTTAVKMGRGAELLKICIGTKRKPRRNMSSSKSGLTPSLRQRSGFISLLQLTNWSFTNSPGNQRTN